jgi:DNA polymerase/3'-5' exonuclease PolX
LVAAFFELGTLLKAKNDFFKAKAFFNASTAIAELEYQVTSGKQLKTAKVKGIGQSSQNKIDEFLTTGKMAAIEDLKGESGLVPVPISKEAETALAFL